MRDEVLLGLDRVSTGYADFQALFEVSLEVHRGELLAVVGANGAGKTSILRAIAGVLQPWAGHVRFEGEEITSVPDHRRARRGIGLVPEGRRLFTSLTVEENLLTGAATRRSGRWTLDSVLEVMPLLAERRRRHAGALSGGEQQAVAIGRALMGNPSLLLLDEVSLGLSPAAVDRIYAALPRIREAGTTVVLVEQDLTRTFDVADRLACVLEGRVALTGAAAELTRSQVIDAYFGAGRAAGKVES